MNILLTRETFNLNAINLVASGDLDLFEAVKNIKFGKVETSVTIDHGGVLHNDQVEPSTSPSSASDGTVLGTDLLQGLTNGSKILGRERTATNSSSVGLDDTDDTLDSEWGDTESANDTTNRGGRRSNEGVGTVVKIKHKGVGTLNEDALARAQSIVHEGGSVHNEGSETLGKGLKESSLE